MATARLTAVAAVPLTAVAAVPLTAVAAALLGPPPQGRRDRGRRRRHPPHLLIPR